MPQPTPDPCPYRPDLTGASACLGSSAELADQLLLRLVRYLERAADRLARAALRLLSAVLIVVFEPTLPISSFCDL